MDRALENSPKEDDPIDTQNDLMHHVHDSIHALVRMGYDFETILQGSKVDRSFLEQSFRELGYCMLKPDLEIITSDEESVSEEDSPMQEEAKKSVQVEIQLFMMRIQLEMNKLSSFLDHEHVKEQLKNSSTKEQLEAKRQSVINSVNELFDKVAKKEDELENQRKRKIECIKEETSKRHLKEPSNSELFEGAENVLVDSGFVKISKVCSP